MCGNGMLAMAFMLLVAQAASAQPSINLSSLQVTAAGGQVDNTDMIKFDLKLVNVDSSSAQFELTDDNKTTINYYVSYVLTSSSTTVNPSNGEAYQADSIKITKDLQLQTNSIGLLHRQEEIVGNKTIDSDTVGEKEKSSGDSGEKYDEDDKEKIETKTYDEVHRFLVQDLEPNRYYEINFVIKAKLAHLSSSLLLLSSTSLDSGQKTKELVYKKVETTRQLQFKFKTAFDFEKEAVLACNKSKYEQASSCYKPDSDCRVCRPSCYQVKETRNRGSSAAAVAAAADQLVLCEACPCDTSRSTGECLANDPDTTAASTRPENKFLQTQVVKCKQCIRPYTGALCNECQNDGVDFYKNEFGQCVECSCNGNSVYENLNAETRSSYKKRKCQAITGICSECLFNTTGKNCHECKPGFHGDALKRTCTPNRVILVNQTSSETSATGASNNLDYLNKKYTYKTLALFSLYIFSLLALILLTFVCIKTKYYQDAQIKAENASNGTSTSDSPSPPLSYPGGFRRALADAFRRLDEATKSRRARLAIHLGWLLPDALKHMRFGAGPGGLSASMTSSRGGIYTAANSGHSADDDRLNLAEYQVFDESLFGDDSTNIYQPSAAVVDIESNAGRNPYKSLTIKS